MAPKEMLAKALFSSDRHDWETRAELFNELDAEFGFEIDVCATAENTKCPHFFSPEQDGLKQSWRGICWMNPPYGSALPRWMAKAYTASLEGATVVCLVPARTDTRWWHDFAMRGEIRFLCHQYEAKSPGNRAGPPAVQNCCGKLAFNSLVTRPHPPE